MVRRVISRYLPADLLEEVMEGRVTLRELYEVEPTRIALELAEEGKFPYPGRLEGYPLPSVPWPTWSLSYRIPRHPLLRQMHREHEELAEFFGKLWDLLTVRGLESPGALEELAELMRKLNSFLHRHHQMEEDELIPALVPKGERADELIERIKEEHRLEEAWNELANRIMDRLELSPQRPDPEMLRQVHLVMRYLCWELWHHSALEEHGVLELFCEVEP